MLINLFLKLLLFIHYRQRNSPLFPFIFSPIKKHPFYYCRCLLAFLQYKGVFSIQGARCTCEVFILFSLSLSSLVLASLSFPYAESASKELCRQRWHTSLRRQIKQ